LREIRSKGAYINKIYINKISLSIQSSIHLELINHHVRTIGFIRQDVMDGFSPHNFVIHYCAIFFLGKPPHSNFLEAYLNFGKLKDISTYRYITTATNTVTQQFLYYLGFQRNKKVFLICFRLIFWIEIIIFLTLPIILLLFLLLHFVSDYLR